MTEEELALLRHSDLVDEADNASLYDELGDDRPAGFRERLVLGDISW